MRVALVVSLPLQVVHGSGTAVATQALIRGLEGAGIGVELLAPRRTLGRFYAIRQWLFNARTRVPAGSSFVLGIDGDGLGAARRARVRYVAVLKAVYADILRFESGWTRRALTGLARRERRAAQGGDIVVCASEYAREAAARHYRLDPTRIHIVPEAFGFNEWRSQLPELPRQGRRVLCVAHLYPRKRVMDLLAAWPRVTAERPDAELRIIGTGPLLNAARARARGLQGCTLLGHVTFRELLREYAAADVFCSPSAQENFGVAVVEAMASGLPLVIARAGAVPEVTEGAVRTVVEVGDEKGLAEGLLHLMADAGSRETARAVNPTIAARYDYRVVGAMYRQILAPESC